MPTDEIVEMLAGLSLFVDLPRPQLEHVAHTFDEVWISKGDRVLRKGFSGTGFYVILEGEAVIRIDEQERATLARGDFFGEISILLGEAPTADVIARTPLHCLVLSGSDVQRFLTDNPTVTFRMLQAMARRLRSTLQWQS